MFLDPGKGFPLGEMDGSQQKFAHALISSGLSRDGYARAMTIMGLETILGEMEGPKPAFCQRP